MSHSIDLKDLDSTRVLELTWYLIYLAICLITLTILSDIVQGVPTLGLGQGRGGGYPHCRLNPFRVTIAISF